MRRLVLLVLTMVALAAGGWSVHTALADGCNCEGLIITASAPASVANGAQIVRTYTITNPSASATSAVAFTQTTNVPEAPNFLSLTTGAGTACSLTLPSGMSCTSIGAGDVVTLQLASTPTVPNYLAVAMLTGSSTADPTYHSTSTTNTIVGTLVGQVTGGQNNAPAAPQGLNYSGQAWDPRCEFGCPPNGLP